MWFQTQRTKWLELLSNFHYPQAHESFSSAGNIGSSPLNCHSAAWVYKQGWLRATWQWNIVEMSLWTQIWGPQQGALRSQLAFLIKGSSCPTDGNAVPTNATSESDQNEVGNKISSYPKLSYIFATWKLTVIFILVKMLFIAFSRFYVFLKFSRMRHLKTSKPIEFETEILEF